MAMAREEEQAGMGLSHRNPRASLGQPLCTPVDSPQGPLPPGLTGWQEALVVGKGTVASTHIYQLN